MADRQLSTILTQLKTQSSSFTYADASSLLSKAKLHLLKNHALAPNPEAPASTLSLARELYEQGALYSIRARDAEGFLRYVSQLAPFYELASSSSPSASASASTSASEGRNKITGLYLLLLLMQGRYAEFHSELESLSVRSGGSTDVESDRYLGYPIRLERWLMEGSYDQVWKAMKMGETLPCEEYGVFSEILTSQIRSEIASSSERAYPSLPLSSTKSLLFLDSEGAVIEFAHTRGWTVRDGQIFFPAAGTETGEEPEKEISQMVIENALGYARQLETIV